jgi:flagellar basal body P-ring formation protein FlgA
MPWKINMRFLNHPQIDRLSIRLAGFFIRICLGLFCIGAARSWALPELQSNNEQPAIIITLQPSAEIIGSEIFLRDIAVVMAPQANSEKFLSLRIEKAPGPGMKQLLSRAKISAALSSLNNIQTETILKGPEFIQIYRACQTLQEEYIRQVLHNYMDEQLKNSEFKIGAIKFHGKNRFPAGNLTAAVTRQTSDKLLGNVKFILSIEVDKEPNDPVSVSAWINRFEEVVFTKHELSRGTLVAEQDLCMRKLNISKAPENVCMHVEDAIGKRIKQNMRAETFLRSSMLETPPMIYKGDRVKIVAGNGLLLVSAKGLAQTDGHMNQPIKVQNINSKRNIIGRVVDHSTVEVNF